MEGAALVLEHYRVIGAGEYGDLTDGLVPGFVHGRSDRTIDV